MREISLIEILSLANICSLYFVCGWTDRRSARCGNYGGGCDSVSARHIFFVRLRLSCNFKTPCWYTFPYLTPYTLLTPHPADAVAQREHSIESRKILKFIVMLLKSNCSCGKMSTCPSARDNILAWCVCKLRDTLAMIFNSCLISLTTLFCWTTHVFRLEAF